MVVEPISPHPPVTSIFDPPIFMTCCFLLYRLIVGDQLPSHIQDRRDDFFLLSLLQFRIHRQRENFFSGFFGVWKISPTPPCVGIGGLKVNRKWVVNPGLDAFGSQFLLPLCASRASDRIYMIDMTALGKRSRRFNSAARKSFVITARRGTAGLGPSFYVAHFYT